MASQNNTYNRVDRTSLSNSSQALSKHIDITWKVDFEAKRLSGSCCHTVEILEDGVATVDFDSSKLSIDKASIDGVEATVTIADAHAVLGQKVSVALPESKQVKGIEVKVDFVYSCDEKASAIQWLDPSATKGGKYPYVFTQCQAIHARSLLPCQDAPGVKTTYSAVVTAPEWCTILMSALSNDSTDKVSGTFSFKQPVPTSAYLIALAGGDLESREVRYIHYT